MANEIKMNPEVEALLKRAMLAEQQLAEAKAALEAKSIPLSIGMSDFSSGTVSVRGLGRNAVSLYPQQWENMCKLLGVTWEGSPMHKYLSENANALRCARFASGFAAKMGKKWPTGKSKTDPDAVAYQNAYNEGKALAMKDATLDVAPRK